MNMKPLKDLFARAVSHLPKRTPKAPPVDPGDTNVPYSFLVNLFKFQKEPRYVTEPQKQWTLRQVMDLGLAHSVNWGPIRVFYGDPEQTIKIENTRWSPNTIMPKPPPLEVKSSPAIYGSEDSSEFGKWLIVVIRDRVNDYQLPMKNSIFGLYGEGTRNNGFQLKKIIVPDIDRANRVTGMRKVNLKDRDDVARALTYAKLCADQILEGQDLTTRRNMQDVMEMDPSQLVRVPWTQEKKPAPGLNPR